jgi:hypothetical protein
LLVISSERGSRKAEGPGGGRDGATLPPHLVQALNLDKPSVRDAMTGDLKAGIQRFYERVSTAGVLSLSEINDDPLMWAHYADAHRGICIGLTEALMPYRGQHFAPTRVSYVPEVPKVELYAAS